ncbi:MAG: hypothetical protein AB3N14_08600, partial [Flavobacteriaceae bacterium]
MKVSRNYLVKNCFSLFFIWHISTFIMAQEQQLPNLTPPSPTVANLMSFEEVPVDYYTGQPDISIPLFSKKLQSGLDFNVALKYHTSGVKIDNVSGWTGTGWSLFAGGSISRTVRGVPDEFEKGPGIKTGVLHNPDFWDYDNLSAYDKAEFNWNAIGTSTDLFDTQLDLYQFNVNGISGRFVIVLESGGLEPKLLTRNQNVLITINYNASTYEVNSFEITDPYGNKYFFDEIESTTSEPVSGSIAQGNGVGNIPTGTGSVYTNNSSWHLTQVKTSNDVVLATLNYITSQEQYTASFSRTTNTITSIQGDLYDMVQNSYNQGILLPQVSISSL